MIDLLVERLKHRVNKELQKINFSKGPSVSGVLETWKSLIDETVKESSPYMYLTLLPPRLPRKLKKKYKHQNKYTRRLDYLMNHKYGKIRVDLRTMIPVGEIEYTDDMMTLNYKIKYDKA